MRDRAILTAALYLILASLIALLYTLMEAQGANGTDMVVFIGSIGLFLLILTSVTVLLTSLHELAHAVVTRLVGADLFGVTIGRGRRLIGFEIGSVLVEVRSSLVGGVTFLRATGHRWRDAAILSAGIVAEALAVVCMAAWQPDSTLGIMLRWATIGIATIDILLNLLPRTVTVDSVLVLRSDGAQLMKLLTDLDGWRRELDEVEVTPLAARMTQAIHGGDTKRAVELAEQRVVAEPGQTEPIEILGILLMGDHRWHEAFELLAPLADGPDASAAIRNNVAWSAVMTFDPQLLPVADRLSERAFAEEPTSPACTSTRGTTLTMLGRADEGLVLLKVANASKQLSKQQRAFVSAFMALADHETADHRSAKKHLAFAEALDSNCVALPEIRRRMFGNLVAA